MKEMYPKKGRVILHVDMNSFYASVEMAYDSELKGKPLAIAGNPKERRGIIVTCSYEARKLGVRTTMPLWEAKKLCPELIIKSPNFDRYRTASAAMFDILRQYTELVEPVSIDEGYMDITDCADIGAPLEIAESIQKRILEQLDLPCSIGIAPNKFLAKTASDMKKPLGITILRKRDIPRILWPLGAGEMHGVGTKTADKLKSIGILSIGDLAKANDIQLKALLGINGLKLKERANGQDNRMVDPESVYDFKSIGNSTTLPRDLSNQHELMKVLDRLSEQVAARMKRKEAVATTISIMIRFKDRKTITRSQKLQNPVSKKDEIATVAKALFLKHWNGDPVRLLGITGTDLLEADRAVKQLDLFSYEQDAKKEPLLHTMNLLREKYGKKIIESAGLQRKKHSSRENAGAGTSFNKDFLQDRKGKDDFEKKDF
ncbi:MULTISPECIES: DNA polymerase IV [Mesobacillus]|uniref:DNA polymerase IV n=2 Tax=Mesobacillus TaxID=2675231 RepID=A0A0D6ZF03_9BACI|nr:MULTISPECIES: DNA polymerase IV [Mesobacillus]KIY23835.1 DNA polymerase IV [Mesobacillus subterraneus]MDQ0413749.1 DNA polymerase-4 [Mesobacillus stamsii]